MTSPTYTVPKRLVPMVDCEQVIADLRNGPRIMSPECHSAMKVVNTYMRREFENLRLSFKTVVFVRTDGSEETLMRVGLVGTPVRAYGSKS